MLGNSCIRNLDSVSHAVSEFRRAVSMNMAIGKTKRSNLAEESEKWKTES